MACRQLGRCWYNLERAHAMMSAMVAKTKAAVTWRANRSTAGTKGRVAARLARPGTRSQRPLMVMRVAMADATAKMMARMLRTRLTLIAMRVCTGVCSTRSRISYPVIRGFHSSGFGVRISPPVARIICRGQMFSSAFRRAVVRRSVLPWAIASDISALPS